MKYWRRWNNPARPFIVKVPPADRTGMIVRSTYVAQAMQIYLFGSEVSQLPKIISLLIFAGNLPVNRCGTGAFRPDIASKSPQIAKFPVYFPDSRELRAETGSYLTAHTTTQSSQTAHFRYDAR
jgi:hypothetical protein